MKHKAYSVEEKLEAIKTAKRTSKKNAARLHHVDVKRIREWCKQENKLSSIINQKSTKRLTGGGRHFKCEEMEEELVKWVSSQRERRLRVSRKMIQKKALSLFEEAEDKKGNAFTASAGWLFKFLKRNHLSLRRRTTIAQKTPDDVKEKVISYLLYVNGLRSNCAYPERATAAADETAVSIDPIQDTTINPTGSKTVSIFSSGNHKAKITVMLAAFADGKKCKPFILLKGKRIPKELVGFQLAIIRMSDNGWMNENTTMDWISTVWGSFSFGRRLLAWDAFRCHKTEAIKKLLKNNRTDVAMIPGGCTGLLQAPDVSWNKPFKAAYVDLYEQWADTHGSLPQNRTDAGNPRPPSKLLICQWVVSAWNSLPSELIKKSFKVCGLTSKLDGSDDASIHALKELNLLSEYQEQRKAAPIRDIENEMESSDESLHSEMSSESSADDSD